MNEKAMEFIKSVGVMAEIWMVIYQAFLSHGMSQEEAITHTKGIYEIIFKFIFSKANEKLNEGE